MTTGNATAAAERALRGLSQAAAALVKPYDVVGTATALLTAAADSARAVAAGLIVRRPGDDHLELLAATSHRAEELEVYQVQEKDGPCFEAVSTGLRVTATGAADIDARWPTVAAAFKRAGYSAVQALPLRWRNEVIGAFNLFWSSDSPDNGSFPTVTAAFADMATLAVIHSGTVTDNDIQQRTLAALDERTVIERAKGVLAQEGNLSMDGAYALLLQTAAREQRLLSSTALAIIDRAATARQGLAH